MPLAPPSPYQQLGLHQEHPQAPLNNICHGLLHAGVKLVSEISRYLVAYFHMTSNTIVEHLDVFKDHLPGLLTGGKTVVMQTFRFDCAKKLSIGALSQQFPFWLIDVFMP